MFSVDGHSGPGWYVWCGEYPDDGSGFITVRSCRYGGPGDRLWVKETWRAERRFDHLPPRKVPEGSQIWFEADGAAPEWAGKLRPSIFCRRWMSRITLGVESIGIERLQDISEEDAKAEGAVFHDGGLVGHSGWRHDYRDVYRSAKESFFGLWFDINGRESLKSNPWVWAISFKRIAAEARAA
jgi:hypothetical protein